MQGKHSHKQVQVGSGLAACTLQWGINNDRVILRHGIGATAGTWASGTVARACGGAVAQPPWGLGGGEATPLQRAEGTEVEARQRGSEGRVVHVWVAPPRCALAKGGSTRGPKAWSAPAYHALLH